MALALFRLLFAATLAFQVHAFLRQPTAVRRSHAFGRAISPNRLSLQRMHAHATEIVSSPTTAPDDRDNKPTSPHYIRCDACFTAYKVPDELWDETTDRAFACSVCRRKFVTTPKSARPLPSGADLVDASEEDVQFLQDYMKEHRKLPGPLKCAVRSVDVSNLPVAWSAKHVIDLFAEYGVSGAEYVAATKSVRIDITSKEGYEKALQEMSNFFYLPGIKLTVRPSFDENLPREFVTSQHKHRTDNPRFPKR